MKTAQNKQNKQNQSTGIARASCAENKGLSLAFNNLNEIIMTEKKTTKKQKEEIFFDATYDLLSSSVNISTQMNFYVSNLRHLIDEEKDKQYHLKRMLSHLLAFRINVADMNEIMSRFVINSNEKKYKKVLEKRNKAVAKKDEYEKRYGDYNSPDITPEDFAKYFYED